ncbi:MULTISPECIES: beta-1,3-glucanase family protein [unclassified Janthinobacterium]|uniref:beta-1,3-glucanase family protein n=1 Tax=unclassified Janthinobacterium TaxID=2610881 RepID=UPI00161886D1|nr:MULTISPECIES: beta-1,3-glucanase family protein [unclassified Janthinobacterium]MBB5609092.1 beta-galactosidase [Janthinobacterium sp. S3T4]MBB5614177.1 beta-galactosidase [Janthinobacterium sp. S3M3]
MSSLAPPSERLKINLGATAWKYTNDDRFIGDPKVTDIAYDDSGWTSVGVPHSVNEQDMFVNNTSGLANMPYGTVWYRKHLPLSSAYAGRKILIEFEGAHTGAQVFINGVQVQGTSALNPTYTHVIGFVPFIVDVTNMVNLNSDNVLAVKITKNGFEDPHFAGDARFGQGDSGLFRPVYMHISDKVHIPENVYAILKTWGTHVSTASIAGDNSSASIQVETNVLNEDSVQKNVTLTTRIYDASGTKVAETQDARVLQPNAGPGLTTNKFVQNLTVDKPILWFPNNSSHGTPYMYRVVHIVSVDGAVVDTVESPLGIRTITWNNDFPVINGFPHHLWGASGRYDYPALGSAVPEEQQWRDLKLLADAGGSLYRPGHSSSSKEFVEAADALGIFIVQPSGEGEGAFDKCYNAALSDSCTQSELDKFALKTEIHTEMIVRDRNNPSILSWESNNGPMDTNYAQVLKAVNNTWDPLNTRVATDRTPNDKNGTLLGCTLNGCELGVKAQFPNSPAWGAEYWGKGDYRYKYDHEIELTAEFLNNWRRGVAAKTMGMVQWYLAETPGENNVFLSSTGPAPVPTADNPNPPDLRKLEVRSLGSSMMDGSRFPKLMYYAYQAAWVDYKTRPVVNLAHHWNRSGIVRVNTFSNCPAVRLLVNGVKQGDDQTPNALDFENSDLSQDTTGLPHQAHWDNVQWQAGTVTAQCLDEIGNLVQYDGQVVQDQRTTAGKADHIILSTEPGLKKPDGSTFQITANGSDAAFITAKVVDANNILLPEDSTNITFTVSSNGNYRGGWNNAVSQDKPLSYHSPGDHELAAEGGLVRIAVRSKFDPGTVTVTAASSDGTLQSNVASFEVVPVPQPTDASQLPPAFVAQPQSLTVSVGQVAHFEAVVSGAAPLDFTWYRNGVEIAGAKGSSYDTALAVNGDNNAVYTVKVKNSFGDQTSNDAVETVVAPQAPVIVSAPVALSLVEGQTATFQIAANGAPPPSYQWYRDNQKIDGATSSSYTIPAVVLGDNNASFYVVASNLVNSVQSTPVTLTVGAATGPHFTQPANQVAALNSHATLVVQATGSQPMTYTWFDKNQRIVGTSATLDFPAVQAGDFGSYTVLVHNAAGDQTSDPVSLLQAAPGVNLARARTATADSTQDAIGLAAGKAVDGDINSRWGSDFKPTAELTVDLGSSMDMNRMILRWDPAYAKQYIVEVSNDNKTWTKAYSQDKGNGGVEDTSFPLVNGQYVRITGTLRGSPDYGYSIDELEVYNVAHLSRDGSAPERYTLVPGNNNVVTDNSTSLLWSRVPTKNGIAQFTQVLAGQYCSTIGSRLPTKEEALSIAGDSFNVDAFPGGWSTWTSNIAETDATRAYVVSSNGDVTTQLFNNFPNDVLCVSGTLQFAVPSIVAQPLTQSVKLSASGDKQAYFATVAKGTGPLTYTWFRNDVQVASSLNPVYSPVVTKSDDGAKYKVIISNSRGNSISSDAAVLTIVAANDNGTGGGNQPPQQQAPAIVSQPFNQSLVPGQTAKFSVVASGADSFTYQWFRNDQLIVGATGSSFATSPVTLADNGERFRVDVTNPANGAVTSSNDANLLVIDGVPSDAANLALKGTPSSSSTESADYFGPQYVNDGFGRVRADNGLEGTRWASFVFQGDDAQSDNQWVSIDLGSVQEINQVVLDWQTAFGSKYIIETSLDNQTWTPVYTQNSGQGRVENLLFAITKAQYVRMHGVKRGTQYGYSLYEMQVYAPALTIRTQPAAQTVAVGQSVHFTVDAVGPGTLTYQWLRQGVLVASTDVPSYDTPAVSSDDNGAIYSVVVESSNGSKLPSDGAVLTVGVPQTISAGSGNDTNTTNGANNGTGAANGVGGGSDVVLGSNLALGKTAFSSPVENPQGTTANLAIDGIVSGNSRWSSAFDDKAWMAIDLYAPTLISQVTLQWENAYGSEYEIQVSNDKNTWLPVKHITGGKGGVEQITFPTVSARYVRLQGFVRATQYGYSLYEFEVYGPANPGPAPQFSAQPAAVAVTAGQSAHFEASVAGNGALTYQWNRNTDLIPGATSASYDIAAVQSSDDGAVFSVSVTNASGIGAVSTGAKLTVTPVDNGNGGTGNNGGNGGNNGGANPDYPVIPGFVTVDLKNNTNGKWTDDQIYVAVIGRDPGNKDNFAYLQADGTILPMLLADNDAPGHLTKNGENFSNYFFTLAQAKNLKLPKMDSGRIFVSMGSPLFIKINEDINHQTGFAGPDLNNHNDPNIDIYFDWYEFTLNDNLYMNPTQVDQFGFPLLMDVYGDSHNFHQQVGIAETRDSILAAYQKEMPKEFLVDAVQPRRILAPGKSSFDSGRVNAAYFDTYINDMWNLYRTKPLVVDMYDNSRRFVGQVAADDTVVFHEIDKGNGVLGSVVYTVPGKPSTQDMLEAKGVLASPLAGETDGTVISIELALEAQIAAALNRHIMEDTSVWGAPTATWYAASPANYYAKFWHDHSVGGKAYGFAYDDVSGQSSSVIGPKPEHLVLGIGW